MNALSDARQSDAPNRYGDLLADRIARIAETTRACDRLLLLSSWSVCQCVVELPTPAGRTPAKPLAFIPSVSSKLQNLSSPSELLAGGRRPIAPATQERHPTTSAQCIAALQGLLPLVGRFQLGTQETKDLTFHPIERGAMDVFEPKRLSGVIRRTIDRGLDALIGSSGIPASTMFGHLHPFTAAQVLRAVAPSHGMYQRVWWESLLIVLWFLNRRSGSLGGTPNIDATGSPSTAFLTHKCVDAIERVLDVFQRRSDRFNSLLICMRALDDVAKKKTAIKRLEDKGLVSEGLLSAGYKYQALNLIDEITDYIAELECDTALPNMYQKWHAELQAKIGNKEEKADDPTKFLIDIVEAFVVAVQDKASVAEANSVREVAERCVAEAASIKKEVGRVYATIETAKDDGKVMKRDSIDLDTFPEWICSTDYWTSTGNIINGEQSYSDGPMATLVRHWMRHQDASATATSTLVAFGKYLTDILDGFKRPANSGKKDSELVDVFLQEYSAVTSHINNLRNQLLQPVETGAKWAELLMNRHLSFSASNKMAQFDPSELAHAVRVVCGAGTDVRFEIIARALHAVCGVQRPDGTWSCQQPFFWSDTGSVAATLSVEIACAVVSTINVLHTNPERFGASREELAGGLWPVLDAMDRFFHWLSANLQSFRLPPALRTSSAKERHLFGWGSDRVHEPGRIHSWVTANTIQFLIEYRRMLQESINSQLRAEFLSYHPGELKRLTAVEPTDLECRTPVISQLLSGLKPHKKLQVLEGPWLPKPPPRAPASLWSIILYGPPGTSKSFLAKAIAAELNWPLVSLSPSDFLARGEQHIESRSQEIFSSLAAGSRLVFFFDEVDELIRDRTKMAVAERSVFSFLTPSFLTKLQDFRDAAEKNEYIFIVGTNYFERIDSAAKRSGRIDRSFPVIYSDARSRGLIIFEHLVDRLDPSKDDRTGPRIEALRAKLRESPIEPIGNRLVHRLKVLEEFLHDLDNAAVQANLTNDSRSSPNDPAKFLDVFVQFSGMLSFPNLKKLCARLEELPLTKDVAKSWAEKFGEEMRKIRSGHSEQFRPEIRLKDYAGRSGATEEIVRVARIIPEMKVQWLIRDSVSNDYALDQDQQFKDFEAVSPEEFKAFKDEFDKLSAAS